MKPKHARCLASQVPPQPVPTPGALVTLRVDLPPLCPVSGNPRKGSFLVVSYRAVGAVVDVLDLARWVLEYRGGHADGTRSAEPMVHALADRLAATTGTEVSVRAVLVVDAGGVPASVVVRVVGKPALVDAGVD